MGTPDAPVERLDVSAYTVPTGERESDGTLAWDSVTCVVVRAHAGGHSGLGYTYSDASTATLVRSKLNDVVEGRDALRVGEAWAAMVDAIRNLGRPGVASTAISAVDVALWDLKARLLDVSLATLVDPFRDAVPIYGSGGFTSYTVAELTEQLGGWVARGIPRVKMKVGRRPEEDPARVRAARGAVGADTGCTSTRTGPTAASRPCCWPRRSTARGCPGWRSP